MTAIEVGRRGQVWNLSSCCSRSSLMSAMLVASRQDGS